jgi:hypothetical protein
MTVNHRKKKPIKNPCPNHNYRSRTIRDGKLEKFCALCINQAAMRVRWKNIRKALATLRRFSRKSSSTANLAAVCPERNWHQVSIVGGAIPTPATPSIQIIIVLNHRRQDAR